MQNIAKALAGLAALAFILAIAGSLDLFTVLVVPEAWSRASSNLALLGILLLMAFKKT